MKHKHAVLLAGMALVISSSAFSEGDTRVLVELPAPMKAHMLQNMRGHLVVIDQLLDLLGQEKMDEAADLAEAELGMSSLSKHGASHIAPYYPEGMREAGTNMHKAASRFSRVAQEWDQKAAYKSLTEITAACTKCHAAYKVNP